MYSALAKYATPDDDAIRAIVANSRKAAPDASIEEIVHFIHQKGQTLKNGKIGNPLAYLIVYVPKCFQPGTLGAYRDELRVERERIAAAALRAETELQLLHAEWVAWLDDPAVSEEDKTWVRKMLTDAHQSPENG